MARDPFRETAAARLLRLSDQNRAILERAASPSQGSAAERLLRNSEQTRAIVERASSPLGAGFAAARELTEFQRKSITIGESLQNLIDPPTARLVREVAAKSEAIGRRFQEANRTAELAVAVLGRAHFENLAAVAQGMSEFQRRLETALSPLGNIAEALARQQSQLALITERLAYPKFDELRTLTEAIQRSFVLYAESGEFTARGGEATLEVARALEELGPTQTVTPSAIAAIVGLILAALQHLGSATKEEVRTAGLITLFAWFVMVDDFLDGPDFTPADRGALTETRQLVADARTALKTAAEAEAEERAFIANLPRAVIVSPARVRDGPSRTSKIIDRLPKDTVVALVAQEGRWRKIAFRDGLTESLHQGWVYSTSLRGLNE